MTNIETLKNKIDEVKAFARVVVQEHGHTKKFAKHIVAFVIKQVQQIPTDTKLIDFLSTDPLGKHIGYHSRPDPSIFSKVRKRTNPRILEEMIIAITTSHYKNIVIDRVVEDSTDVDAFSRRDTDARWGKRTVPKKRQSVKKEKIEDFFGYKLHMISDAERELPLSIKVISGNRNDKVMFPGLFQETRRNFRLRPCAKFIADAQYSSHKIRGDIRSVGMVPLIPISGNKYMKTESPRDRDYGMRWSIEHIFFRKWVVWRV